MNKILSILITLLFLFTCKLAFAEPTCITNYGRTVCGYDCKADYGEVKCAQTPNGACTSNYGQVYCWDPPMHVHQKAECISNYGQIACGYHCIANYGEVKCAKTPDGICTANQGTVTCWDPKYPSNYDIENAPVPNRNLYYQPMFYVY